MHPTAIPVIEGTAPRMAIQPQSMPIPTVILARNGETTLHVTVIGELDALSVNRLREHVDRALAQHHPATVALDLDEVPFLDASAAIHLRRLHHHVADAGSRLSITAAQPFTWWLLNAFTLTPAGPCRNGDYGYLRQPEPGS
jgi:anti-anti-sigma factor